MFYSDLRNNGFQNVLCRRGPCSFWFIAWPVLMYKFYIFVAARLFPCNGNSHRRGIRSMLSAMPVSFYVNFNVFVIIIIRNIINMKLKTAGRCHVELCKVKIKQLFYFKHKLKSIYVYLHMNKKLETFHATNGEKISAGSVTFLYVCFCRP